MIKIIKWTSERVNKTCAINMDLIKKFSIHYKDKKTADRSVLFIHFVDINNKPEEFLYKLNKKINLEAIYDFLNNLIFDFLNSSKQYTLDLTVELKKWEGSNKRNK